MNKISCELTNWDRFLIWLKKINLRHLKTPKLNTTKLKGGNENVIE